MCNVRFVNCSCDGGVSSHAAVSNTQPQIQVFQQFTYKLKHGDVVTMFGNIVASCYGLCSLVIVAFLENTTIGYSFESLCGCVCVCVRVCVFLHDNSKRNRSRNTKSQYIVVYENSSDEFDIELHRIKVKVTVGVQKFSPFTTIQTVRSYSSTLVQARNLILSIYLHLILLYKIYECRHA